MKTFLTTFLGYGTIGLLMLSSCKKDGALVTSNGGKPGTLTSSATTLILDKTKLNDTSAAITFNITSPNYGYSAAVTNTLQIDAAGDNWKSPTSVTLGTKALSQRYSTSVFNTLLLKLNLSGGAAAQVNVRVAHSISANVAPIYSNVVNLTVTPFNLTSWLYVVGSFQGYSVTAPDSIFSATSNGIYTGIYNFPAGKTDFLILPAKNFANKYATTTSANTTASSVTYSTEYVSSGGNNLYAPAAGGWCLVTLNLNTNTITVSPTNFFSVIGSTTPGGDFSTDEDLKFVNSTDQDWEGVFAFTYGTFPGSFKVRQDHMWAQSWGIPKSGSTGYGVAGTLNESLNQNIPITASGNYKVTFAVPATPYDPGTAPSVTATYTVTKQ